MNALAAFKASPLFRDLDRRALRALAEAAEWRELRGGQYLYRIGDAGDALYLVVNGRIRVQRPDETGEPRVLDESGLGQTVGEISVIGGEDRTADALAVRDSGLLRISRDDFERLLRRHPDAMLGLMRLVVARLRRSETTHPREALRSARTFAVLPGHAGLDLRGFTAELTRHIANAGAALRLDPERVDAALGENAADTPFEIEANRRVAEWLNRIEDRYRYLIYQATGEPGAWTRRCLRQADRILVLVDGRRDAADSHNLAWLREAGLQAPVEVVLLGPDDGASVSPLAWRHMCGAGFHHHVPAALPHPAMARLARLVTGHGLCLVLGGGGARGFAHLGLLRALEERGMAVDAVAGTSMGALVAGMVAVGMDADTMLARMRETFVDQNFLNDYSLSRIALIGAQKFRGRLAALFGERRIEELPIPFFCESTNLTQGIPMVHDSGRLADWVGTSMSVPGIAPPTVYHGELLVDGGLMRSIPFETMHALGRGPVLVSDVSNDPDLRVASWTHGDPESLIRVKDAPRNLNIFKILFHTATLTSERESRDFDERADLVVHSPVRGVGMFDWDQIDGIVYRAYHHADEVLDRWLAGDVDETAPPAEAGD